MRTLFFCEEYSALTPPLSWLAPTVLSCDWLGSDQLTPHCTLTCLTIPVDFSVYLSFLVTVLAELLVAPTITEKSISNLLTGDHGTDSLMHFAWVKQSTIPLDT